MEKRERHRCVTTTFGWTLGGPIFIPKVYNQEKNKTFFFVSQEFRRVVTYTTQQGIAPTAEQAQGIFTNPVCVAAANGVCTSSTTRINNINPVAQSYLTDIYAKAGYSTAANNTIFPAVRNIYNFQQELYRLDHNFGPKLQVFGRYLRDFIPTTEPLGLFGPALASSAAAAPAHAPIQFAARTRTLRIH